MERPLEEIGSGRRKGVTAHPLRAVLALLVFLLLAACVRSPFEPPAEPREEDIFTPVDDQFENFVLENGGEELFGEALDTAFTDTQSGRKIQYFRPLMLEHDAIANEVRIAALGAWAFARLDDWETVEVSVGEEVRRFERTDLTVQGAFKEYYEKIGGEDFLGLPVSPQIEVAGRRTQFFENASLEWWPGAALEQRVQMGTLGLDHYRAVGIYRNPGRFNIGNLAFIDEVEASVRVASPILYAGEEQTIYVFVEEPDNQRPVSPITVTAKIYYDGQVESLNLGPTDDKGMAKGQLTLEDATPGQRVQVVVAAISPVHGHVGSAAHSFKTWW